jgi:hypothetical protein
MRIHGACQEHILDFDSEIVSILGVLIEALTYISGICGTKFSKK